MADEPTTPDAPQAALPADAGIPATPQTDPTPTQTDSRKFDAAISSEIDDLWAQVEGRAPKTLIEDEPEPVETEAPEPAKAETKPEAAKTDAPKAETPPPDAAEIERQAEQKVRARMESERLAEQQAEARIRAEAEHRRAAEAYVGAEPDYALVNTALRAALTGDYSALDGLDVVLPNGQKVSQVKGAKGLTQEEAANLLNAWDTARKFEDAVGDRKVQRIIDYWNAGVLRELADPDVDAAAVTKHASPHEQMAALRDSVREKVTARLTAQHADVVKAKDAEIAKLTERVTSLTTERGNVNAGRAAATAATLDRPGQPGALRTGLPTPEELAGMNADEAFKSGAIDRILQSIPGGLTAPRRRAG